MFKGVLEEYRVAYIGRGNMESTAEQAVYKLSLILKRLNKNYGVQFEEGGFKGLSAPVLLRWYASMTSDGLEMSTRNNYVTLLNPFLSWATDMEYIVPELGKKPVYNVLSVGKLPKEDSIPEEERTVKAFIPEQVKMLMTQMTGRNKVRDRAIIALLVASGLRVSELCSLNLSSVLDQPRGTIYLRRKGGSWKHTEIADFCYKYIEEYLSTRDLSDHDAPLFLTKYGCRCNRKQIWEVIAEKEKSLGLKTGVHILRHTTLSNVEKKGGASVARDIANHSSFAMTNKYSHTTAEERASAINQLDWNDL